HAALLVTLYGLVSRTHVLARPCLQVHPMICAKCRICLATPTRAPPPAHVRDAVDMALSNLAAAILSRLSTVTAEFSPRGAQEKPLPPRVAPLARSSGAPRRC